MVPTFHIAQRESILYIKEKIRTFCQVIICSTGTVLLNINPVRCVEKYCFAYCDSENCWMSDARSCGRIGITEL